MKAQKILEPASDAEAKMASIAHDCLVAALWRSKADHVEIDVDVSGEDGSHMVSTLNLPINALRFFAEVLRTMARQEPLVLVPQKQELTIQEAASLLHASTSFLVKELDARRIPHLTANRHRRIEMKDLRTYQAAQQSASKRTLDELAKLSQDAGMEF